jgi:hypothetical protein
MSPSSRHLPVITAFAAVSFYLIHKYQRHSEEEDNFIVNNVLPSLKTRHQQRYYANERRACNRKLWSEFQAELSDRQFRRATVYNVVACIAAAAGQWPNVGYDSR